MSALLGRMRTAVARPPSVAGATEPQLPPPGASGLADLRNTRPIPVAGVSIKAPTLRDRGTLNTSRAGSIIPGDKVPAASDRKLSNSDFPTNSTNVERFAEPINARHARLYGRKVDVGGMQPWHGMEINPRGGIPSHPRPVNFGVPILDPYAAAADRSAAKGTRQAIAAARRGMKPIVTIRPGLGGLDVAQAPRFAPGRPSGRRDAMRSLRPRTINGTMAHQRTVPSDVSDAFDSTKAAGASVSAALTGVKVASPAGVPSLVVPRSDVTSGLPPAVSPIQSAPAAVAAKSAVPPLAVAAGLVLALLLFRG